jgi:TM2 domain-containing membrane protein YozV
MKRKILLSILMCAIVIIGNAGQETNRSQFNRKRVNEEKKIAEEPIASENKSDADLSQIVDKDKTSPKSDIELIKGNLTKKNRTSNQINESLNLAECDLLILKSGEEIKSKITEIGSSEIKYKKCDNPEGPTYSINKSEVLMIKYPNGTNEIVNSGQSKDSNNNQTKSSSGKSQLIALLLAILLGSLGVARFYLGHTGMGILYLLTGGLCGIGYIIDIILIATGSLKPKNGEYGKKI